MTEAKFTKGPWKFNDRRGSPLGAFGYEDLSEEKWPFLITMPCPPFAFGKAGAVLPIGQSEQEQEANAHLIAAAPEMYEALDYLMASLRTPAWNMAVEKAAAALAKARGEEASDE